jgi:4-amino-4-deoxy-L-arabinose transferase-like glycosyltransferase
MLINQMRETTKIKSASIYMIPLLIAALLKAWLLSVARLPFNADEAVVALMARHINQGEAPIFFYGQAYLGSLDAILIALGFRIFGEHILVIRAIQSLLYLGTVLTTVMLANRLLRSSKGALFAGLLVSLPPVNVSLYTTVSLGGYNEMLLLGNLLLLGGLSLIDQLREGGTNNQKSKMVSIFLWSLGAGFAFWVFGLTLVFTIPVMVGVVLSSRGSGQRPLIWRFGLIGLAGGLLGSLPWWFDAVLNKNTLILTELTGGAIADVNQGIWLLQPLSRLVNLFVFGGTVIMGLRPPWGVQWLVLPLLPLVLVFWLIVFLNSLSKIQDKDLPRGLRVISGMGLVLAAGFIFSPYGNDPSGRYFLPLIIPMAIFGAAALIDFLAAKPFLQIAALTMVLFYNLTGTYQAEYISQTGITTQFDVITQVDHDQMDQLIDFLKDNDIKRGYTNYWVSYPLAFLSQEEMIFVPRLPYHEDFRYTARDDRYPPYSEMVESADQKAFITTNHSELNDYLRDYFSAQDINWKEKVIGDYHLFFDLSEEVNVTDLGLGKTTTP